MVQLPRNSANAQEMKLRETIARIDAFHPSVALDDLDGQTAYGLTVRDMLVKLRGLAVGILPSHLTDRLNEIEIDANDFVAASAAYAELEALVPTIKDVMELLQAFSDPRPDGKGHCPSCGPDKNASVLASKKRIQEGSYGLVSTTKHYRLLQCLACDAIYFQYESVFSEDWDIVRDPYTGEEREILRSTIKHWPLPSVLPIPNWEGELDDNELQDLLKETHGALDSGFLVSWISPRCGRTDDGRGDLRRDLGRDGTVVHDPPQSPAEEDGGGDRGSNRGHPGGGAGTRRHRTVGLDRGSEGGVDRAADPARRRPRAAAFAARVRQRRERALSGPALPAESESAGHRECEAAGRVASRARGRGRSGRRAEIRAAVVAWFRRRAAERLPERVAAWHAKAGVPMPRVKLASQQKRWGSCDQAGTIRLNWRIIQAPMRLVDYVVVHELVHLRHRGHGRDYWQAVGRVMPDYERRRRDLRERGAILVW